MSLSTTDQVRSRTSINQRIPRWLNTFYSRHRIEDYSLLLSLIILHDRMQVNLAQLDLSTTFGPEHGAIIGDIC